MADFVIPDEDDFDEETTEVTNLTTKLLGDFKAETEASKKEIQQAAQKARFVARTAKKRDSVQNLKAVSQRPPASNGMVAAAPKKE